MINYLIFILSFIIINILMFYSLYLDIKFRRIPNYFFKYTVFIIIAINSIDLVFSSKSLILFFTTKFLILFLTLIISVFLFNLKIIGGADGKLLIILFLLIPINYSNFTLIFSYLNLFLIFYSFFAGFNFLINKFFKNKVSFKILFMTNKKISKSYQIYIISFYKFYNISDLFFPFSDKYNIKSLDLYFNYKTKKIQILTQYRPPLIIIIIIVYYLLLL